MNVNQQMDHIVQNMGLRNRSEKLFLLPLYFVASKQNKSKTKKTALPYH